MNYTKGEWKVITNDLNLLSVDIGEKGFILSATSPRYQIGLTPEQANLIAAAPALYEALKAVKEEVDYEMISRVTKQEIDAALKQAEGG